MEYKEVSLMTINNGAASELFQEEFKKVMGNINDVCVQSEAPREINLKIKIKPSKDRTSAITTVSITTKMGQIIEHESSMFISKNKAYVTDPRQEIFDFKTAE